MNYILNTKTKKVEIYWDNANEYQGLINFLSQFPITEEVKNKTFEHTPSDTTTITWANHSPYCTNTLGELTIDNIYTDGVTLNNGAISAIKAETTATAVNTAI